MGIASSIKNSDRSVKKAIQTLETKIGHADFSNLSASRLVGTDANQRFVSISTLSTYVSGTANQVIVTDDGDGTITLSTPQDIHTGASPTFADLTLSSPSNIYSLSHDSFADFVDAEHVSLPNTIANVLSDHDLAAHTTLGLFDESSDVDHDQTTNFVADEHVAHSTVSITAGTGLTGGGDISANRTFNVDVGIADDKIVQMDDADAADDDYAKFTADGLEGRSYAEVKTDLSLNNVENTALSTWAGTASITTLGTVSTGTWEGTDVGIAHGGTGQSTAQAAIDALTNVSAATNEHVLTKDTATGNAIFKAAAGGDNDKVGIDSGATPGYLGAASNDGVLRTETGLGYTDGGDYVTIGLAINDLTADAAPDSSADYVLTYDAGSATHKKVLLDDLPGGTGLIQSRCSVYLSGDQTVTKETWEKVEFDTENYDNNSEWDAATNYRFQPTATGYYNVTFAARLLSATSGTVMDFRIRKNGTSDIAYGQETTTSDNIIDCISKDVYLTTSDYIECYVYHNDSSDRALDADSQFTYCTVHRIAAASPANYVQTAYAETGAVATGTTLLPFDDTIPQNTEGIEVITVSITPKSATNKLIIEGVVNFAHSATTSHTVALFQDSTADALACAQIYAGALEITAIPIKYVMTAGTTSSTTFKLRCGGHATGTVTINGFSSNRKFGGVMLSNIRVTEVTA